MKKFNKAFTEYSEKVKSRTTDEMKEFYQKRTEKHINLVKKWAKKIAEAYPEYKEVVERAEKHDESKYKHPEIDPYVLITWKYKMKDEGKEFDLPDSVQDELTAATEHHVKNNSHHPEYHTDQEDTINPDNRDKPEKLIDATKMPDLDIIEMLSDWFAVGEERGNTAKEWADENIDVRWKFNKKQKDLIYKLVKLQEE